MLHFPATFRSAQPARQETGNWGQETGHETGQEIGQETGQETASSP